MTNSKWVTLYCVSRQLMTSFLWPTGSEWHCTFCEMSSFPMTNSLWVSLHIFCERQSHYILPMANSPWVPLHIAVKGIHSVTSCHMINRLWVTLCIVVQSRTITPFLMTNSLWVTFHIVMKGIAITSFPLTSRKWVRFHILWKAFLSHLLLWPTESEWHCTFVKGSLMTSFTRTNRKWMSCNFCETQSHDTFYYDQQSVSLNIAHFVNRVLWHLFLWPTPACESHCTLLWKAVISYFSLWSTDCEWHCTLWEGQSYSMTNSLWVTLHWNIFWKGVFESHILLWPTVGEWHCTFVKGSLIASFPMIMTNRMWVTWHIFWRQSFTSFQWPTVGEWCCTICERWSHHIPTACE